MDYIGIPFDDEHITCTFVLSNLVLSCFLEPQARDYID